MRPRRAVAEINVVPYIDVMLVLLVIFMATAPLLMQGVEVDLPKQTQHLSLTVMQNLLSFPLTLTQSFISIWARATIKH